MEYLLDLLVNLHWAAVGQIIMIDILLGGDNAVEVTNYLIDLFSNPNFVVDADGSGMAGLRDGSISAIFTGSWDSNSIREILGENMGAAALPTYNLNGETKQMYAYAGSKAIGVNAHSEYMVPAVELAIYLGSAEAQKLHYDLRSVIPCNTELLASDEFSSNPAALAQNDTIANTSVLQPSIPEMGAYWSNAESMGKGLANGEITAANALEKTDLWNEAINNTGL